MHLELDTAGQQLVTHRAWIHPPRHLLTLRVQPVLPGPVAGQGHDRGVLAGAVLAAVGPVQRVLHPDVVLQRGVVDEPLLLTVVTLTTQTKYLDKKIKLNYI